MIHKSELGEHAQHFPMDLDGHVPDHGDDWRKMNFAHGPHDPDEPGITVAERATRMKYLDEVWWPQLLAQVNEQKSRLAGHAAEDTPFARWCRNVHLDKPHQYGFTVGGEIDPD